MLSEQYASEAERRAVQMVSMHGLTVKDREMCATGLLLLLPLHVPIIPNDSLQT